MVVDRPGSTDTSHKGVFNGTEYQIDSRKKEQKEWLVCVHGVGMNRAFWQPQIDVLSTSYRVLSYDIMGHGNSLLPPDPCSLKDYNRQLFELLDHLQVSEAKVLGHSLGALIALEFALNNSDRVTQLVALNGVYCRPQDQAVQVQERAEMLANGQAELLVEETLHRWFGAELSALEQERRQCLRQWLLQVEPKGYARAYQLFARSDRAHENRLEQLSVPALFATGELDPNSTPEMSKDMSAAAPYGQFVVLPEMRHAMPYVNAETVNGLVLDFFSHSVGSSCTIAEIGGA